MVHTQDAATKALGEHMNTELTRFDIDMDGSMEPCDNGRWVLYDDISLDYEWQGLTEQEMFQLWVRLPAEAENRFAFARAIEAKLKEKNT